MDGIQNETKAYGPYTILLLVGPAIISPKWKNPTNSQLICIYTFIEASKLVDCSHIILQNLDIVDGL